jgi:hypothetical protein
MSVRLSATTYISVAPNGRIFVKFEAGDVNENLTRSSKFCSNHTISGTYLEELSRFLFLIAVRIFYGSTTVQGEPIIVFQRWYIVDRYMLVNNNRNGKHRGVSMAALATRTRHNIASYCVYCLSCCSFPLPLQAVPVSQVTLQQPLFLSRPIHYSLITPLIDTYNQSHRKHC